VVVARHLGLMAVNAEIRKIEPQDFTEKEWVGCKMPSTARTAGALTRAVSQVFCDATLRYFRCDRAGSGQLGKRDYLNEYSFSRGLDKQRGGRLPPALVREQEACFGRKSDRQRHI
jgi:hypothetical protein